MRRTLLVINLVFVCIAGLAQPGRFRPDRLEDDEIIQMQVRDIVEWLHLKGDTREMFVREYTAFRKEIDAVAKNALPPQRLEDEEAIDNAIQNNFTVSRQILDIRMKYYPRFKQFLKPSQIQLMYHLEMEAGRRMLDGPDRPERPEMPDKPAGKAVPPMGLPAPGF